MATLLASSMERRWSTDDVDAEGALAYWRQTVCAQLADAEIDVPGTGCLRARLRQAPLGPLTLSAIEASPQTLRRTPQNIVHNQRSSFFLIHRNDGRFAVEQSNRAAQVCAGDCVLLDSDQPYSIDARIPGCYSVLTLPGSWLRMWFPRPEELAARPLRANAGWGCVLSQSVGSLDPSALERLALDTGTVADHLGALLAMAAGAHHESAQAGPKRRNELS